MKYKSIISIIFILCVVFKVHGDSMSEQIRSATASTINSKGKNNQNWVALMSPQIAAWLPDEGIRRKILSAVFHEAKIAGVDPELILGIIIVESKFDKYAVSKAGAIGLMQIMPFWLKEIKPLNNNLFDIETNIHLGCTILKNYIDVEKGNLFYALGRYNGSRGQGKYPQLVMSNYQRFQLQ